MNIFKKKVTVTANVLPKLGTPKNVVKKCLKSTVSLHPSTSNMVNEPKHCSNPKGGPVTIFINHCKGNWVFRKAFLVIDKMITLFVNTFTANDKYSLLNRDNLTQPIQIELSQKQKTFSQFFLKFSNAYEILKIFFKKRWNSYLTYFRNYELPKTF